MNILKQFQNASGPDIESGLLWYQKANETAQALAHKYNIELKVVAGIIAALSPACKFSRNLIDAEELIVKKERARVVTYKANKDKALRILYSGDPDFELNKKETSFKTYNFYRNILDPLDINYVTIDRHILSALDLGIKDIYTKNRYNHIRNLFIKIAAHLDLIPNQLQAIVWVSYKSINLKSQYLDVPF